MTFFHLIQLVSIVSLTILCSCAKMTPSAENKPLSAPHSSAGLRQNIHYPAADRRPHLKTGKTDSGGLIWLIDSGATASFLINSKQYIPGVVFSDRKTQNLRVHGLFANNQSGSRSFEYSSPSQPTIRGYTIDKHSKSSKTRYQGIIGLHTLKKENAILSISHKQLIWNTRANDLLHVQLSTHRSSGHMILSVNMNGVRGSFIVDTGAAKSLISQRTASRLELRLRSAHNSVSGFYGSSKISARTTVKLRLRGSEKIYAAPFLVADMSNITNVPGLAEIDGLIGFDFLQRHFTAIDFRNGRLYLKN